MSGDGFASDLPVLDAYLDEGFESVFGMSSRFSATILGWLMKRQTELGVHGHAAEIGTFEGRFFIAMCLALAPGERAFGNDIFEWPSPKVLDNLRTNLARHGVAEAITVIDKGRSDALSAASIRASLGGGDVRVFHVDGDHQRPSFLHDIDLAASVMHPNGLIVLDDMLHPEYPLLIVALHHWLEANRDWRVLVTIDREDVVAAAKIVLCRNDAVALYEEALMERFRPQLYVMGSEWERFWSVVLTPRPRLARVD